LPVGLLIAQLNLILRGWARYHRHATSTRTFARVDNLIFGKLWRWACRRHPTQGARWVRANYFTQRGGDRWVFHGRVVDSRGQWCPLYRYQTAQTGIRRHVQVRPLRTRMIRPGRRTSRDVCRPGWPRISRVGGRRNVCGTVKEGNARCADRG
jgi:hypothetical protein